MTVSTSELIVECPCGVEIKSGDRSDLVAKVQQHATEVHDMHLDEEQILEMAHPS